MALSGCTIAISGTLSKPQKALESDVSKNGGTFANSLTKKVTHLITTADQIASKSAKVVKAQEQGVHIVSEDWLVETIKAGKKADEKSYVVGGDAGSGDKRKKDDDEAAAKPAAKKTKAAEPAAAPAAKMDVDEKKEASAAAPAAPAAGPSSSDSAPALTRAGTVSGPPAVPIQNIEVCFSFDTTGSMYPCLTQVRQKISQSVERLFKTIAGIRIAIIAHGDYCDKNSTYVIKMLDFSTNKDEIVKFVETAGPTGGGDAPECYELVLRDCQKLHWTPSYAHALVLIGDDLPHEKNSNPERIDWRDECKKLSEQQIRVYGVEALARGHSAHFYRTLSELTGGVHLTLEQFASINDLFMAVCFREFSADQLQNFEKEVTQAGRMNRGMVKMFDKMLGRETTVAGPSDGNLKAVPSGRFQVLDVPNDCSIKQFVEHNGLNFKPGRGFYEFMKSETVQGYKEIVLRDKASGDFYEGAYARELLGLSAGEKMKISPKSFDKYQVFIQSTSYNRKLIGGTKFLYEIDDWVKS